MLFYIWIPHFGVAFRHEETEHDDNQRDGDEEEEGEEEPLPEYIVEYGM